MLKYWCLLLTTIIAICSCEKDDIDATYYRDVDSTTYIIKNYSGKDVIISLWINNTNLIASQIIKKENTISLNYWESGSIPSYLPNADSCFFQYEDKTVIKFYPVNNVDWEHLPIKPQNHNDSLTTHYPFRHSNCIINIANINGKQKVQCSYELTQEDYTYAKTHSK